MKAPDNNVLKFALARRVILVEGDTEFILTEAFYPGLTGRAPEDDGVPSSPLAARVSAVNLNWQDFRRNRVAALRDNDSDYQQNCVERFAE